MAVKGDVKEANATLHNECKKPSENTKRGISRFPQLNNRKDGVVTERLVRDALLRDRKSQLDSVCLHGVAARTAEKLRYMSKFAMIFSVSDNTQLMCTQPIANFAIACL
jgi:hypothetical protein